ncbi:hypothetical protein HMPREF0058_0950, partial [Actinomyces urogenitalis DSM 15434]
GVPCAAACDDVGHERRHEGGLSRPWRGGDDDARALLRRRRLSGEQLTQARQASHHRKLRRVGQQEGDGVGGRFGRRAAHAAIVAGPDSECQALLSGPAG